ncbi:oxidoreductase [Planosporangium flavigriseum]|uniref:Oxidoreductase n=1 Tax=Planosporangium flavigriseum TaxID=373681 RepID=A0A8J3LRV2_9ACTN|nr:aldo/keto reductase [Planosporangium flavigriseum]NJC67580.1 oxidoreductase [Planosporangium flavigriseum]GIG75650.1 oxidoreductase [Planosporangium flavigriseum]
MPVPDARAAGTVRLADCDVPRLGYGAMRLPGPRVWGPPRDRDEALAVLRRAVELGVRVIDTAWYYGPDVANELIAAALRPYPEELVLVTKLGGARRDDGSWYAAVTAAELRAGCERDLRVLGLEAIPVVHLRWMDQPDVRFEDALGTTLDLRAEGKIQRIGLSNVTLDQLEQALAVTDVATVSNQYGLGLRDDQPVLDRCAAAGIPYLPFFPLLAGGGGADDRLAAVAVRHGATPTQVALAWLLARSPVMLPIPGTSRVAHLEENLAAGGLKLTEEDLAQLEG